MISKSEFEDATRVFLDQLSVLCLMQTTASLEVLPNFLPELQEGVEQIKRSDDAPAKILSASFGIVHEYTTQDWRKVLDATYEHYLFLQRKDTSGGLRRF